MNFVALSDSNFHLLLLKVDSICLDVHRFHFCYGIELNRIFVTLGVFWDGNDLEIENDSTSSVFLFDRRDC